MKVNLIDYTGAGNPDPNYAAKLLIYTKNTRLQGSGAHAAVDAYGDEQIAQSLNYIANTIRSSWEFIDYTFQIEDVSRAFTHQFVRTRTGSYAQQSQRTVSMEGGFDTVIPESFKNDKVAQQAWDKCMNQISDSYCEIIEAGYSPQDARGVLPTNVATNIIAKFNLRSLADMAGKRRNIRAQGEYAEIAKAMCEEVIRVHPWAEQFLWPERTETPALEKILRDIVGNACPAELPLANDALKELDKLKSTWG